MPVTNYHTCNGRILGETTAGVRTDYLTDALGSVTATVDATQNIVNTYRYKPYGETLAKTGAGADPRFLWTGDTGSRTTLIAYAEQYNRARHYGSRQGQWTTVDSLWPDERSFGYARQSPPTHIDPNGTRICPPRPCTAAEVQYCKNECLDHYEVYVDCTILQGLGFEAIDCMCKPPKCPTPLVTELQAEVAGRREVQRRHGHPKKCSPEKKGQTRPAKCTNGTHYTITYSCPKGKVTLSILCCDCEIAHPRYSTYCFFVVKP